MKHIFSNPDEYKEHSALQYDFAHKIIRNINIEKYARILDIGCGDGKISADMAEVVSQGSVIGTDISQKMINSATKEHTSKHKNLGFMVMDAEKNFFYKQFDIVTSFCCLHWVKNQLKALQGIKNALLTNGKAILLVPLRHEELYTSIETTVSEQKWVKSFYNFSNPHNFFTLDSYSTFLETAGFKAEILQKEVMSYEFKYKQDMELFLKAWLPHMNLIQESDHDEFLSDISRKFIGIINAEKNKFIMPLTMLKIVAIAQH